MRTSTAVFLFALAGSACATSESIPSGATRGGAMNPFDDGAVPDTGTGAGGFGADPGAGGFATGGLPPPGGFPSNGGFAPTGGARPMTGGAPAVTGGAPAVTGGAPPVMGGSPNGGSPPQGGTAGSCSAGEKVCGGICSRPAPSNGCGPQGCTACSTPAPANGIQACINDQCDFNCLSGFTKSGSSCTSTTGSGGGGGACNASSCPACILATPCCKNGGGCGCSLFGLPCA